MTDNGRSDGGATHPKQASTIRVVDRRHHANAGPATDNPAPPTPSAPAEPVATDGQEEINRLRARVDELARAYSRNLEEQKEFRQRLTRENERVLLNERFEAARTLVETIDDLDRALSAANDSPLAQGVRAIRNGLIKRLASLGVDRISAVGGTFDPNTSEAVEMVEVSDPRQNDAVIDEIVAGYKMGDRVVRPAKVRVGRVAPPAA
jgi:molecular chaperone GrpE